MNERIKRLAEQATEKFTTYFDGRGNVTETYFDKEKFALLIVRECTNICDDIADPCLYRNQDSHQRMAPGASYASKVIKLRFLE